MDGTGSEPEQSQAQLKRHRAVNVRDKDCGSLLDSSTRWRDERAENRDG